MFLIRDYYPGDAGEINALAVQAFAQYAHFYDDWPAVRDKLGKMSALAEFGDLFVAERDGRLLGAVVYLRPGAARADIFRSEWAVMRLLVVAPDARSQGLGRALAEICLTCARMDGADILALHTSSIMPEALRLYQRLGFQWSHAVPSLHGVAYDVHTLRVHQGRLDASAASGLRFAEAPGSRT